MSTEKEILHDSDIREPLYDFLEEQFGKVRIFEEKRMGNSRADAVMVTEHALYGIEIKSDADTYTRLSSQVQDYDRYFDRNFIVVGTSHACHIEEHVPEYWGILTVEQEGRGIDFYMLRRASDNPNLDRRMELSLLWRPELAHLQELNGMPRYKEKSKGFVIDKILSTVSGDVLLPQICEELFERDYSQIADTINEFRQQNGQKKRRKRRRRKYKPLKG